MRQRALEADVVVVNHHLLCADLAVKDGNYGSVIPPYDTLVLDEAHLIEDVATQYFGVQVSSHKVDELVRDVERELKAASLDARELRAEAEGLRLRSERFFARLARLRLGRLAPGWMTDAAARGVARPAAAARGPAHGAARGARPARAARRPRRAHARARRATWRS